MYFRVDVIRPPKLTASQFPAEIEAEEGSEVELAIQVEDAYPPPVIQWLLNTGYDFTRNLDKNWTISMSVFKMANI